jgi:putative component of membrane protein insertase Oxa1/YidC/SpoIIIJ protein YidD
MKKILINTFFIFIHQNCFSQNDFELKSLQITNLDNSFYNSKLKKTESAANDYIGVYQKFIGGIRGQDCPMYPSCSNFGLKTFNEKSFITAFALTSDRLLRCGHDHKNYSNTLRSNGLKHLDYPFYDKEPEDLIS